MRWYRLLPLISALLLPHLQLQAEVVVVDSVKYELKSAGAVTQGFVIGYVDGVTDIIIPRKVNGCNVYQIKDEAFNGCTSIRSIVLQENITEMGRGVFQGCSNLCSVTLSPKLDIIPSGTFGNCMSLTTINIPKGVKVIGNGAFDGCNNLTSVTIPAGVTEIGESAFRGCEKIDSIVLPESLNEISYYVFYGCKNLTSINLPKKIDRIQPYSFSGCCSLTSINIPDNVISIGDDAFFGCTSLSSITIPDKVTSIGSYAFYGCSSLTTIILPNVEEIGNRAFMGCTELEAVTIPCSIKSIAQYAFFENSWASTSNNNTYLKRIYIKGDFVADYSVLEKPVITDKLLVFVEEDCFNDYLLSTGWKSIGKQLYTASMLKQKTVELIADGQRSSLFQALGDSAQYITNLKLKGSINGYDIMALRNKTSRLLYLDLSETEIVANDGGYEYYTGYSLTDDNMLGDYCFYGTKLIEFVMPKSVQVIGDYAFADCRILERVISANCVEKIGDYAFSGCQNLKEFDLPNTLNKIGENAFYSCKSLGPDLIIPDNVQVIDSYTFYGCSSLDSVHIGKNVSSILDHAFGNCSNIKQISFNRALNYIGNSAFYNCSNLLSVSLPYTVETIERYAFNYCSSLQSIKIPSMLKQLGEGAFLNCNNIESVYTYTVEPTSIGQNSFSCYTTATLYVPRTSSRLYEYNTQWSRFVRVREFDEPYDAFYLNGDYELNDSTGRLDGEPDAEMFASSGLIVYGSDTQTLDDIEIEHDGTNGATIIGSADDLTGNQVNLTAKSLKVNISVEGDRWYFFCFPFDVERDSVECTSDCVWYSYDGNERAAQGSGWDKIEPDALYLEKGVGYIFKASRNGSLSIHVNSYYLTFIANDENTSLNTYTSNDVANAHWNFIGNPYISYYDVQDLADEYDAPIVVWNGNGYDVYRPGDDNYQLKPFEAFFVQKDAGASYVEFLPENRLTYNQAAEVSSLRAARRAGMGTPINLDRQLVNIVLMGQDSVTDRTRIVYSVNASMDYEIGVDAAKFQADGVPQLYTLNGKTRYAINERPMGSDEIKLGYTAPKAGTYTLSVPRHDAEVEIYDNVAKSKVDFTFGDYSFQSQAGTFNDRFVVYKTGDGATKVENGFRLDGVTITSFDGGIDIVGNIVGKVQVYSDSGMLLAEPVKAGRVELGNGVYIIKVSDKSIKLNVNRGGYAK